MKFRIGMTEQCRLGDEMVNLSAPTAPARKPEVNLPAESGFSI